MIIMIMVNWSGVKTKRDVSDHAVCPFLLRDLVSKKLIEETYQDSWT